MGKGKIPDADGQFENAPYFNFNDGKLKFDTNWVSNANDNYGSASGFSPKSLLTEYQRASTPGALCVSLRVLPSSTHRACARFRPAALPG